MIKIRYADLPGGLHVRAVARGRDTVIYLVPGLTVDQRRAALRRARSSARMGHGPPLSATGVTCAMVADRIRTTVGNAAAAMRVHPAMFVPITVVILSATVAYFLLMSVTIKVRPPQAGGPGAHPSGRRGRRAVPGQRTAVFPPARSCRRTGAGQSVAEPSRGTGAAAVRRRARLAGSDPVPDPRPAAARPGAAARTGALARPVTHAVALAFAVPDRIRAVRRRRPAGRVPVVIGSTAPSGRSPRHRAEYSLPRDGQT